MWEIHGLQLNFVSQSEIFCDVSYHKLVRRAFDSLVIEIPPMLHGLPPENIKESINQWKKQNTRDCKGEEKKVSHFLCYWFHRLLFCPCDAVIITKTNLLSFFKKRPLYFLETSRKPLIFMFLLKSPLTVSTPFCSFYCLTFLKVR